jgi:hypothetical protein
MGDGELSELDARIIDRFLAVHAARKIEPERVRAILLEMYPALGPRLEIVVSGPRRLLVRR